MNRASTSAPPRASRCRRAMAATSSHGTASSARFWPRAMAGRAGSPSTMCSPASPRARSAGFAYFVTRIATAASSAACRWRCAAAATTPCRSIPPMAVSWAHAGFQMTTGVERFLDSKDLGAKDVEPDSFFYDKALRLMGERTPNKPLFTFIYLGANHFPWGDALPSRFAAELARAGAMWRPSTNICAGRR
uniref:Uncharacterized protein n=1 Tax=Bradyrhizobium japonicum TaxID=375 RepID=Q8GNI6_BRAJP|nr:hypothetical protein [Bradyrhizobium japonicum]